MDNKLFRYSDFLNESKIEMLLEANITYTNLFNKVLDNIDSSVSKSLKDLAGKDVDVNTNFIDVNRDKDSVVFFKPDDKVSKAVKILYSRNFYETLSKNILGDEFRVPENGQVGEILKEYTLEEANDISGNNNFEYLYRNDAKLVIFMWRDSKGLGKCIYDTRVFISGPEAVKKSEVSVGRFVKGILNKADIQFKDSDIEDFVYKYRVEVAKLGDVFSRFKLLKGDDIKKYYHYSKYEDLKGTLGSSCMRYDECQEYFGIYVKNPDVCNLVVLMSDEKEGSICGRALLWTDNEGRKIMDRIYTIRTQDEQLFKEFAKKSGFFYKKEQNMNSGEPFISPENGEEVELYTSILLSSEDYEYYPYMDTFKFFYDGSVNNPSTVSNSTKFGFDFELTNTNGGTTSDCNECGGEGDVECYECDGRGSFRCNNCDGDGTLECDTCGGAHEMECPDCDGSGEDEEGAECSGCSGTGTHTCGECGGEDIDCGDCDGEGRIDCDYCEGEGHIGCPECG